MTKMRNDVGVSSSTNSSDVSYRTKPRSATLSTSTLQLSRWICLTNQQENTPEWLLLYVSIN